MPEEEKSALDVLAEGNLSDSLRDEPEAEAGAEDSGGEKKAEGASPELTKLQQTIEELRAQVLESKQELQFHRGYLQRSQAEAGREKEPEKPQPKTRDWDRVNEDIKARGSEAIADLAREIAQEVRDEILQETDRRTAGRLTETQRETQYRQAMANELDSINREFSDAWTGPQSDAFKREADAEAMKTLTTRLGREPRSQDDLKYFQVGDLRAAASLVYARWMRAGKIGKEEETPVNRNSSVREIARRVPASDNLGNGNRGASGGPPKTIEALGKTYGWKDAEISAARRVFKSLKEYNPSMTEASYCQNYIDGEEVAEHA